VPAQDGRGRPPTLKDVALHANVSKQTISRVINNKGEVAGPTRQRVLEVIRELGYQPNSLARSLVTSRSLVIGLVVPDISLPFYPEIARGVEDGASEAGYSVFLCNVAGKPTRELQALERLRGHRVAGVIVCNSLLDDEALEQAVAGVSHVVLVNRELDGVSGAVIWPGYERGAALATEHLIAPGRSKVAYLGIDRDNRVDQDKLQGYQTALERAGLRFDPQRVSRRPPTLQGGYDAMASLVGRGVDVDGIFAFNDLMAIGAMRYAATHGIAIPGEVAIVGFGGSDVASMVTPALSTIAVPLYAIGVTAVQELLDLINSQGQDRRQVRSDPQLLVRESSAPDGKDADAGYREGAPDGTPGARRGEGGAS
jgi:LacI family transcriptional regulator